MPAKDAGVLGIQAKHQPHAKCVQTTQRFGAVRFLILFEQSIIQSADDFTGLQRDFHLFFGIIIAGIHKKLEPIILFFQIGQTNLFRLAAGAFHVIDIELAKVTSHHPARVLGNRQLSDISLCLLERVEQRTV